MSNRVNKTKKKRRKFVRRMCLCPTVESYGHRMFQFKNMRTFKVKTELTNFMTATLDRAPCSFCLYKLTYHQSGFLSATPHSYFVSCTIFCCFHNKQQGLYKKKSLKKAVHLISKMDILGSQHLP